MARSRKKRNIDINLDEAEAGLTESVERTGEVMGVKLVGAFFHCTSCGRLRPASKFGLRITEDGIVRNQAQCSECR